MGLFINLLVFTIFLVVAITVSAVGYIYLVDISTTETADDVSNAIGTIIAYGTLLGTLYYAIDELFKTINKLTNKKCSRKSRHDCTKHNCEESEHGCCKHKCRRAKNFEFNNSIYKEMNDRYMAYADSKWPLAIHIGLLISVICMCSISFFFSYPSFLFETQRGISGTSINVYGIGKAKINNNSSDYTLWNAADIAVPELENVLSFITTKRVKVRQTLGHCSESPKVTEANCTHNDDCTEGALYERGHGVATGNCTSDGTCEVRAWCPIRRLDNNDPRLTIEELEDLGMYTLHIINHVTFDLGPGKMMNYSNTIAEKMNNTCKYDEKENKGCPVFPVKKILKKLSIFKAPENGTAISIRITYRCVVDDKICLPEYSFTKLYNQSKNLEDYNYNAVTYPDGTMSSRIYQKATGIFFLVEVDATIHYRSHTKLVISAAGAFAAIGSIGSIAELATLVLVLFSFCGCFCIDCDLEKWCCKHKAPAESESDSFLSHKLGSKV